MSDNGMRSLISSYGDLVLHEPSAAHKTRLAVRHLPQLCFGRLSSEVSLDVFFRLMETTGQDKFSGYRLRFWQRYLNAFMIHQAWVVLAPKVEKVALEMFSLKSHQYGQLEKSRRVDDFHSVLLMRVGNIVVAEWSHAGKCRFWQASSRHAPKFFKMHYRRDELIDFPEHVQQHYFSQKGLWQQDAQLYLADQGIILDDNKKI